MKLSLNQQAVVHLIVHTEYKPGTQYSTEQFW